MHLYEFARGSDLALTRDPTGKNLPGEGSGWQLVKEVTVHHAEDAAKIGASYQEVTKCVADDGFYAWSIAGVG